MKNCSYKDCEQVNPQELTCFAFKKSSKDGLKSRCKSCISKQEREKPKTEISRESSRKRTAKYRALHPDRVVAQLEAAKQDPHFKEKAKIATAKYRKAHPERILAQLEKDKQSPDYKEKRRATYAKRRAKNPELRREAANKRNATPERKAIRREIAKKSRRKNLAKNSGKSMRRYAAKLKRVPVWLTKEHHAETLEICKELQYLAEPGNPFQVDHIIPLQGKIVSGFHVPWNLQILPRDLNVKKLDKILVPGTAIYDKCEAFRVFIENARKNKNRPSN